MDVDFENLMQKLYLSRQTIQRRFQKINDYLVDELQIRCNKALWISLCLDESTDSVGMSQLSFFLRAVDEDMVVTEELLSIKPLTEHTRGVDIYNAFSEVVSQYGIKEKLSSIAMDGCYTNFGTNDGFLGYLRKSGINIPTIHCFLHKFSLAANKSMGFESIMSICTTTTNKLRGGKRSMRRRMFRKFLSENGAKQRELFLYCEVRWLSRGKFLERFWQLLPFTTKFIEKLLSEAQGRCIQKRTTRKRARKNPKKPKTKTPDELLIDEYSPLLLELEKLNFKMELAFAVDFFWIYQQI